MERYNQDVNSLVRSIIIKSSHQCDVINRYVKDVYGDKTVDPYDYKTHRYYMNLNGEYHQSNKDIMLYIIEENKMMKLDKTMIAKYTDTKNSLLEYGLVYKTLVSKYPTEETLIKGIINPIDKEKAYKAKDGSIIGYSSRYINKREIGLINELSKYTENIYWRWFNIDYIQLDRYYVSTFLAYLYSNLHVKIEAIRLDNIHTHKVSDFHFEQFMSSTLDVETKYMNEKSKMWLYQNLRAARNNISKEETLQEIIDNVITPNNIAIGELKVKKSKLDKKDRNNNELFFKKLNHLYYNDGVSVRELLSMAKQSGYLHQSLFDQIESLIDEVNRKVGKNNQIDLQTKTLHMNVKEFKDYLPTPRINLILDNLFYMYNKATVDYKVTFLDPNTNRSYDMLYSNAIKLLAYFVMRVGNIDGTQMMIKSTSVINDNTVDIKDIIVPDYHTLDKLDLLDKLRPIRPTNISKIDEMVKHLNDTIQYFIFDWLMQTTNESQVSVGNLQLNDLYKYRDTIRVDLGTINKDIRLKEKDGYDYISSMKTLVYALTDEKIKLDLNEVDENEILSYANLVKKTTSYNVQILTSGDLGRSLEVFDPGLGVLYAKLQVNILRGWLNGLEPLEGYLTYMDMSDVRVRYNSLDTPAINSTLQALTGMAQLRKYTLPEFRYLLHTIPHERRDPVKVIVTSKDSSGVLARIMTDKGIANQFDYTMHNNLYGITSTDKDTKRQKVSVVTINKNTSAVLSLLLDQASHGNQFDYTMHEPRPTSIVVNTVENTKIDANDTVAKVPDIIEEPIVYLRNSNYEIETDTNGVRYLNNEGSYNDKGLLNTGEGFIFDSSNRDTIFLNPPEGETGTLAMFVKPIKGCILTTGNEFIVRMVNGRLYLSKFTFSGPKDELVQYEGDLHHLTITWSRGKVDIYVNAVKVHTTTNITIDTNPHIRLYSIAYDSNHMVGEAGSILLLNKIMRENHISELYNNPETFILRDRYGNIHTHDDFPVKNIVHYLPMLDPGKYLVDIVNYKELDSKPLDLSVFTSTSTVTVTTVSDGITISPATPGSSGYTVVPTPPLKPDTLYRVVCDIETDGPYRFDISNPVEPNPEGGIKPTKSGIVCMSLVYRPGYAIILGMKMNVTIKIKKIDIIEVEGVLELQWNRGVRKAKSLNYGLQAGVIEYSKCKGYGYYNPSKLRLNETQSIIYKYENPPMLNSDKYTIECKFKTDDKTKGFVILANNMNILLGNRPDGKLLVNIPYNGQPDYLNGEIPMSANTELIVHVVVKEDKNNVNLKYYLNGILTGDMTKLTVNKYPLAIQNLMEVVINKSNRLELSEATVYKHTAFTQDEITNRVIDLGKKTRNEIGLNLPRVDTYESQVSISEVKKLKATLVTISVYLTDEIEINRIGGYISDVIELIGDKMDSDRINKSIIESILNDPVLLRNTIVRPKLIIK